MEDSVVAGLRRGPIRDLFDQTCTVTNYPGSGNNWYQCITRLIVTVNYFCRWKGIAGVICRAVGYYTHGTEYYEKLEDTIRRMVEKCSKLHGFLIMHSLGGGTGSGLGTAVLKLLANNYPTVDR